MKIAVLLADGFEEIEALAPADIWRRLGIRVILAGVGGKTVRGAHGVTVEADSGMPSAGDGFDCVYLPGGLPGATNLRDCSAVVEFVREMYGAGKICAAICAAPIVLAEAGLASGRRVTGYPGTEKLSTVPLVYTGAKTEDSGDGVLTGCGPGAACELALRIARKLGISKDKTDSLAKGMFL